MCSDVKVELYKHIKIDGEVTDYIISDYGNCYNTSTGKDIKGYVNSAGRHFIRLRHNGKMYGKTRARWMAIAFIPLPYGNDYSIFDADHINDDRTDDRVENIQWLTSSDNVKKCREYYDISGAKNPNTDLNEDIVRMILQDASTLNLRPSELSKRYGINRFTITKIVSGINWKHIYSEFDMSNYSTKHGPNRAFDEGTIKRIKEYRNNGMTYSKIVKELGLEQTKTKINLIRKYVTKF